MTRKRAPASPAPSSTPAFAPARVIPRHDGWAPERQLAFVEALAQSGCVTEAAEAAGMSVRSAYRLRQHWDGDDFAMAWDGAIEQAMDRLSDAVVARAIHGVATPVFYKGEQIGERRTFDESLARFLLQHRVPDLYSGWTNNKKVTRADRDCSAFDEARLNLARKVRAEVDRQAALGPSADGDDSKPHGS